MEPSTSRPPFSRSANGGRARAQHLAQGVLGYVLYHKNASGFLAREINIFLAAEQIAVARDEELAGVDWTWWVRNKLVAGGQ